MFSKRPKLRQLSWLTKLSNQKRKRKLEDIDLPAVQEVSLMEEVEVDTEEVHNREEESTKINHILEP